MIKITTQMFSNLYTSANLYQCKPIPVQTYTSTNLYQCKPIPVQTYTSTMYVGKQIDNENNENHEAHCLRYFVPAYSLRHITYVQNCENVAIHTTKSKEFTTIEHNFSTVNFVYLAVTDVFSPAINTYEK